MTKRRVVVTGVGIVSPNGIGKEKCWESMINGVSAIKRVTEFDVSMFNTKIAAQVHEVLYAVPLTAESNVSTVCVNEPCASSG